MQVPYSPIPSVGPSTAQPNDYINTQASPLDFGGQIGAATEKLGSRLGQAADMLMQHFAAFQGMQNETLANQSRNAMADQMTDANLQFKSLTGQAAVDAYPAHKQQLQQIYTEQLNALPNPQARQMFGQVASRYLDFHDSDAANWAAEQNRQWQKNTATGNVETAINQGNQFASDPAKRQLLVLRCLEWVEAAFKWAG